MTVFRRFGIILLVLCCLLTLVACNSSESREQVQTQNLIWPIGAVLPTANDFVSYLPAGHSVSFLEEYRFVQEGTYTLIIADYDEKGKEAGRYPVTLTLILDREPPQISGAKDIQAYIGEGIAYRSGLTCSDNCMGAVTLSVDTSAVDLTREGVYPVTYLATDAAGNTASVTVSLYLYEQRVTLDMLWELVDPVILSRIPTAASPEMQAREVHAYIYYGIAYVSTSDKNDWIRAAYDGLRTGMGDCYTYFAVSKAFFERLGIPNMDVERTPGRVPERHYWNLVNLGTAQEPAWYHFDACPLQGGIHNGCLLTDAQVAAYTRMRQYEDGTTGYFYAYQTSDFPASATVIITQTPLLEPYMEER